MNIVVPPLASIDIIGRPLTCGDLLTLFTFASGLHFNLTNIIHGFSGAKDKVYAITTLMPYVCFFFMLFSASYSRFWSTYTYFFVLMNGLFLTYVTGVLNLNTMAGIKMQPWFYEPLLFIVIVVIDATQNISNSVIVGLYVLFFVQTLVKYLAFMSGVINQLLEYLDIPFVHVKPVQHENKKQ
jgi:hypothetical protein